MSAVKGKEAVARTHAFLAAIPFNSLLGIQISRAHADGVTLYCKVRKELLNSNKVLHGGVSASIADAAVGVAIQHRFEGKRAITTVEMKVNYFRPVAEGTLFARAKLLRVGSTLCIGQVDLTDDKKNLVGVAIVTYIFLDARGTGANSDSIVVRGKK
ncbi:MAG TPA: PaaI family thioesterase [Bryobacteraceae bacterium]|jgi:acyl-CoA thioesterase|nr:PaaI family thioesterase [Bryobacteraceae bacterium]